jgi:hypothetical protein
MNSITLRKPGARGARLWSVTRDGATLETRAGAESKPLKSSTESHSDEFEAQSALEECARTKLRDGYVLALDRAEARPGSIVFACAAGGGGAGVVGDLSMDGRFALTAGHRGAPVAVWVEVVDTVTGERRRVFEREHPRQLFLHSASFDRAGENVLLSLDQETLLVELSTGAQRTLAQYGSGEHRSNFNPHVLRPKHDRDRSRWCVFDAGTVVRVLDERFGAVCEIPLAHPTTELRAASVSPDGTLLALYRVSRGIVYNHSDAAHDQTQLIELRRTSDGALLRSIDVQRQLSDLTISPNNERLVVSWYYGRGPVLLDGSSGRELASAGDGGDSRAFGWDFDRSGRRLAVGSYGVELVDGASLAPVSPQLDRWPGFGDTRVVRFCDDDRLLGAARAGALTLHKL